MSNGGIASRVIEANQSSRRRRVLSGPCALYEICLTGGLEDYFAISRQVVGLPLSICVHRKVKLKKHVYRKHYALRR